MRWRVRGDPTRRARPLWLPLKQSTAPPAGAGAGLWGGATWGPQDPPCCVAADRGAWGEQTPARALECTAASTSHRHKK